LSLNVEESDGNTSSSSGSADRNPTGVELFCLGRNAVVHSRRRGGQKKPIKKRKCKDDPEIYFRAQKKGGGESLP